MIDPFSDEADPLRKSEPDRRRVLLALAVLPVVVSAAGCAHPAPACPTQPANSERCRHRFYRHYRG